uniref:DNA polymerase n=1 Tax=Prevotella sp. TaxID=59823 RepID=UPI004029A016
MDRLFLLDAYALIYRSYYAFLKNPRINSKGLNTSAIMGFVNTLNEVITKEQPTYMAVAFDHGKTFRHEAFPAYKAQREETPEDIRSSVPIIKDILEAYHIPVLQADGFEADDVIGTLATAAGREGIETYMLTPDKDYGQLVGGNVYIYRPRHGGGYDTLGESEVTQKYGIATTAQVIDLLALMGDSADNFPGCPGVGEKTAAKLITQFGSIDNMLAHTDEIKGKLREKVEGAVDDIRMSRFLATIRTDVPIALDLEKMKMTSPDEERLEKIFQELEFRALTDKIIKKVKNTPKNDDLQLDLFGEFATESQGEPKNASILGLKETPHDYQLIESEEEARKIRDYFLTKEILSFDTETTSTNAIDAELVGLSFAVEEFKAVYVSVPAEREAAQRMVDIFRPLYEDEHIMKVGQNIKYDYEVLRRYGIEVRGPMFDTMLAHYIVQPELHHNMDYMAETLLGYQTIHIDQLIGPRGKGQRSMRDLQPQEVYEYAAEDADVTLRLKNVLEQKLKEVDGERLFYDIEMPLVPVLAEMELTGVCLDTAALAETGKNFNRRLAEYEQKIYAEAGETFNISSPKQVGDILFGKMKIVDKPKKTKTGQYVTSEEVLTQLRSRAPIVDDILSYRGLKKLLGTYVEALPRLINPRTGHIHT